MMMILNQKIHLIKKNNKNQAVIKNKRIKMKFFKLWQPIN